MTPQLLLQWLPLLPVAAMMLAAVYLPGTVLFAVLKARPTVALAGGPLLTAALLSAGAFVLGPLGIPFGWAGYLGLVVAAGAIAVALRHLVLRSGGGRGERPSTSWVRELGRRRTLVLLAAGIIALATLWLPLGMIIDPWIPNPKVDPMYHYNVLNAVLETGNVSMNSAVDYNYGLRVGHVLYPTVWHAFVVLGVPFTGIVPAANAFSYLVTPAIFVINAGLLARVVFRKSAVATVAAVLGAGALPAFGVGMLLVRAFWPNALATAMLPGLIVVLIMFLRRVRWSHMRRNPWLMVLDALLVMAAALGLGATHPSVLFSFVFIIVPLLISTAVRVEGIVRRTLPRRTHRLFVGMLIALPLVALALALIPLRVRSYLFRSGEQAWDELILKGVSLLVNWPTDVSNLAGIMVALVYLPLLLGGLLLLARRRGQRWIPIAWLIGASLVAGSYVPIPVLSGLSGLWYSDTYRLFAVQAAVLPLAVAALARWAVESGRVARAAKGRGGDRLVRLRPLVVGGLVACALLGNAYITVGAARHVGAEPTDERPVMEASEMALLERIGDELPEGSVVIGDPASGVAYLPLESDVESVFTQMNLRDVDRDGIFLAENFDRIHEDPRVCQLLDYYGIGYFYEDSPIDYNYSDRADAVPGFYGVDTSHGFTLVDESGTAKLWRIDACGPIEPPADWWQRYWRREAFVQLLDQDANSGNPAQPD